ncbi:MAG: tetratricopeptide repeat protein, partial [Planctomycetes bacterium]|nr:tetratricopeptide repeat protein [Planctomycetota bacterium]
AFGDGELTQADIYYKQALELDGNAVGAYVGLAQVSRQRNDNKMALNYAEEAYRRDPENVPALMETGQISLTEGKNTYKRLRKGMQLNATPGELANVREDLTVYLRNAKRAFERINKLEPNNKTAYDWLGETYRLESMIAGDEGERANALFDAMEAFKSGYEIDPPNYREAFRLGEIYRQRGELDIAKRYFQTGVDVCPADRKPRECHWHMAEIAEEQNALDDALYYWGKVMEAYDATIPEEAVFYNKARERVNAINLKLRQ